MMNSIPADTSRWLKTLKVWSKQILHWMKAEDSDIDGILCWHYNRGHEMAMKTILASSGIPLYVLQKYGHAHMKIYHAILRAIPEYRQQVEKLEQGARYFAALYQPAYIYPEHITRNGNYVISRYCGEIKDSIKKTHKKHYEDALEIALNITKQMMLDDFIFSKKYFSYL